MVSCLSSSAPARLTESTADQGQLARREAQGEIGEGKSVLGSGRGRPYAVDRRCAVIPRPGKGGVDEGNVAVAVISLDSSYLGKSHILFDPFTADKALKRLNECLGQRVEGVSQLGKNCDGRKGDGWRETVTGNEGVVLQSQCIHPSSASGL
jgi:hypothetical protein